MSPSSYAASEQPQTTDEGSNMSQSNLADWGLNSRNKNVATTIEKYQAYRKKVKAMFDQADFRYAVSVVGDKGVGKSSLLEKELQGNFYIIIVLKRS
jgi:putative ribosome biogenesis GTPase RsgA